MPLQNGIDVVNTLHNLGLLPLLSTMLLSDGFSFDEQTIARARGVPFFEKPDSIGGLIQLLETVL